MSANSDQHKNLLVKAIECKSKAKFNIEQFLSIVTANANFSNVNQRGLFIQYISELLLKAFLSFNVRINGFIGELQQREAKKRKRREGGGDVVVRRKKNKSRNQGKRNALGENRNIQDLSNQSLSNPSNIQRPRINEGENKTEDNSNPASSRDKKGDESQDSKGSGQNNIKMELNKITEQIRGHQETYISDGMQDFQGINIEDNSQSNSSGRLSGEITDIHEKLKIISISKQKMGSTTRKKTRAHNTNRTTKTKKKNTIIQDQITMIDETKDSQRIDFTMNESMVSTDDRQLEDIQDHFMMNIDEFDGYAKRAQVSILHTDNLQLMKQFINLQRQISPDAYEPYKGQDNEFMPIPDTDMPYPDYTMSQPIETPVFSQDLLRQVLDINQKEVQLDDLVQRTGKGKSNVFYQMLWRAQNDEITIEQQFPQNFGKIIIRQN